MHASGRRRVLAGAYGEAFKSTKGRQPKAMSAPEENLVSRIARALLRFVLWCLTRTFYRLKILGARNVPEQGGALLVCNHLSHVDALLLLASLKRPVRFLMYKG